MPNYDLGLLITLDSGLALLGLLLTFVGIWAILRQMGRNTRELATITREVAFMIRRQYADIDRDLQEIKDLLEGQ